MNKFRSKEYYWTPGGNPLERPICLRWDGSVKCPICNDHHHNAYTQRYHPHICEKCVDSGVVKKMDDIFIWFIQNKKPTLRERWKFNILEKLAYDAYRNKWRADEIKKARQRKAYTKVDVKYDEEERVLACDW